MRAYGLTEDLDYVIILVMRVSPPLLKTLEDSQRAPVEHTGFVTLYVPWKSSMSFLQERGVYVGAKKGPAVRLGLHTRDLA